MSPEHPVSRPRHDQVKRDLRALRNGAVAALLSVAVAACLQVEVHLDPPPIFNDAAVEDFNNVLGM